MAELMLLEYKEKTGQFHHNMVIDRRPQWELNTNGWETIALTGEDKAGLFEDVMDCKLHRREKLNQPPYNTEYIRKEWKHFCYVYNSIISSLDLFQNQKEFIEKHFDGRKTLARLGNGHFSNLKEENELSWAWEYDPHNLIRTSKQ